MPLPPEEFRTRLEAFVEKWRTWNGSEKEAAQPFLIELLACYGVEWKAAGIRLEYRLPSGAWADLRDLHRQLDEAVAAAYGWPRKVAHDADETNRRLLERNRDIAAGKIDYHPFA